MIGSHERAGIAGTLSRCRLFGGLSDGAREALAQQCRLRECEAGEVLCRQGEVGEELFVLSTGVLEVFTTTPEGGEVVLARRDEEGHYAGEQSVRQEGAVRRSANLRAAVAARVVVVPKQPFLAAMAPDAELRGRLQSEGEQQAKLLTLAQQSLMYRALVELDQQAAWGQERQFAADQVVFRQGEPADCVHVIVKGEALVTREQEGRVQTLAVLKEGQCFGEVGVMARAPRTATVTARAALTTFSVSGEQFLKAVGASPGLHDYLTSLRRAYTFAGAGRATQFDGAFMGHPALVTLLQMPDGAAFIANHVIDQAVYVCSLKLPPETPLQEHVFEDRGRNIRRELGLHEGKLARVFAQGPWDELGQVHQRLLEHAPVEAETAAHFAKTGELWQRKTEEATGPEQTICFCLGVTRGTIEGCLARGHCTLRAVAEATGASTVCGGCTGRLAAIVGDVDGVPVRLAEVIEVLPNVRSFRFEPLPDSEGKVPLLPPSLPGQHAIVAMQYEGRWLCRPYTLTSPGHETRYREVTVKQEPHGLFSNWLHREGNLGATLRLSRPQGEFWADLDLPEPIVCLVAGIGVTPALAIARTLAARGSGQTLAIDYSVRFEREIAYAAEWQALTTAHPNILVRFRRTATGGRLGRADYADYHARHPRARYYICGPLAFQRGALKGLREAGVPEGEIHFEEFTPTGHAPKETAEPRKRAENVFLGIGLVLLAAYLMQAALGWSWRPLLALQRTETWRLVTGFVLLAFLGFQWFLPWLRLTGRQLWGARHYPWHKYLGAFAPLIFFAHAPRIGAGHLIALGSVYLANAAVGLCDKTLIRDLKRREEYARGWLVVHVVLSVAVTGLALLHLFNLIAY